MRIINLSDLLKARGKGSEDIFKLIGEALDVPDCGEADCPLHGNSKSGQILDEEATLSASEALELSQAAIVGASNELTAGSDERAKLLQVQARLWLDLHDRLEAADLEIPQPEPSSGNAEQPVS